MRMNLLDWIRSYCRQNFHGNAKKWEDATDYAIGDLVVGTDNHVYKSLTVHTSNKNGPPPASANWAYTEETLPGGIILALDKLEIHEAQQPVKSESLGDYSVSYEDGLPPAIKSKLTTYRSMF